jgi:hypothetical protein
MEIKESHNPLEWKLKRVISSILNKSNVEGCERKKKIDVNKNILKKDKFQPGLTFQTHESGNEIVITPSKTLRSPTLI